MIEKCGYCGLTHETGEQMVNGQSMKVCPQVKDGQVVQAKPNEPAEQEWPELLYEFHELTP